MHLNVKGKYHEKEKQQYTEPKLCDRKDRGRKKGNKANFIIIHGEELSDAV